MSNVTDCIRIAMDHYGVKRNCFMSRRGLKRFAIARQAACWLAHEATEASLPTIGRLMGGRDHTTIIHAIRQANKRREEDIAFRRETDELLALLVEDVDNRQLRLVVSGS